MRRWTRASVLLLAALTCAGVSGADAPAEPRKGAAAPASLLGENDLDRLLAKLDAEEKTLKVELDSIGPALEVTRRRLIARGRAYIRQRRAGFLPVGGGFDALVDHAARTERLRMALERDVARESELGRRGAEITDRLSRLRAERAPLDVQRAAMERARAALAQEEERRAAFTRAFETSARPDYLAIYGVDLGSGQQPSAGDPDARAGFRALKGRLPFPIAGRAEVRKVTRRGSPAPGLELSAAAGAPVRSVAAGRVAFADSYADYGLTVILDHGDHYYSLYAGLGGVDVRVGDQLAGGARVGSVVGAGQAGGLLYFELRRGAEAIDPGEWFGL